MKLKLTVSCLLLGISLQAQTHAFSNLYVIGDSLSDQGNLLAASREAGPVLALPPIPTPDHYYQGRFSNGETYVGLLAQKLGFSIKPSSQGGNNFAYGGARTYFNRLEIPRGPYARGLYPWSIDAQRQSFLNRALVQGVDRKALFLVYLGSNDLVDVLDQQADPKTTIQNAITGTVMTIETFKAAGAKTVMVPNVVDLGIAPSISVFGAGAITAANQLSQQYNAAQDAALNQLVGVNLIRFDSRTLLNDMIKAPWLFGFKNTSQACFSGFVWPDPASTECKNPDDFLFWDVEHPTRKAHSLIAQQMYLSAMQCQLLSPLQPWLRGKTLQVNRYTRCSFSR